MIPFDESFVRMRVPAERMDELWAEGWRHFGPYFFRYAFTIAQGELRSITPLRLDLSRFVPSRNQRRVLKRNRDVRVEIRDTVIDDVKHELFYRHRERFEENIPESLFTFLSEGQPAFVPCRNQEICVYGEERLLAASFLDIGHSATSAVYAMFDPEETRRSLGIFTMLVAIRHSTELGCRYYYPGYATKESSFYDYKKRFAALEYLEWETGWRPLEAVQPVSEDEES
jgi:arginyl-tRNA--protein-N-Asp/Glu arginylyltransferase